MRISSQACLMKGTKVDNKVNMLIVEIFADIIKGKVCNVEQKYYFIEQDDSTLRKKIHKIVNTAYEAGVESKIYFQTPLDPIKINRFTKRILKGIQRDYEK